MKLASGRVTFAVSTLLTIVFLVTGSAPCSLADAGQQRPDKPKLQKPQQPKDEEGSRQEPPRATDRELLWVRATAANLRLGLPFGHARCIGLGPLFS